MSGSKYSVDQSALLADVFHGLFRQGGRHCLPHHVLVLIGAVSALTGVSIAAQGIRSVPCVTPATQYVVQALVEQIQSELPLSFVREGHRQHKQFRREVGIGTVAACAGRRAVGIGEVDGAGLAERAILVANSRQRLVDVVLREDAGGACRRRPDTGSNS